MKVTNEMLQAAIESLLKDKIIPMYQDLDGYTHTRESIKRALIKALRESK